MDIGVNLDGMNYWNVGENAFKDKIKASGEFIGFYDNNWDNGVLDSIPRDSNGYPNEGIPYTTSITGVGVKDLYVRKMLSASGRMRPGQYVFLYDGTGTIHFGGNATITGQTPGRIEVTFAGTNNIWLEIAQSDPAPNHMRNFRLVSRAYENDYLTDMWEPNFLDKLAPFSTIRPMQWTNTIGSPVWEWSQRTPTTYNCQNEKSGVAYEYIIDLCNTQNKDLWICVPHMADTNYLVQMATLFKNNLDPNLTIYLEYSNELWNWDYPESQWAIDNFTWLDPSYPHNPLYDPSKSPYYNMGLLQKRTFEIWYQVFGADSNRVKRVVAGQAAQVYVAQEMISAIGSGYDYISPAWYFGASPSTNFNPGFTTQDVIDSARVSFFQTYWSSFSAHYTLAQQHNKKVICYEGGQHITALGDANYSGLQTFYDAQVDPAIYTLYNEVIDTLRNKGTELIMAYVLAGGNSRYGSWGHITNVDAIPTLATAPKYIALIDNLPENTPGCGTVSVNNESNNNNNKEEIFIYPNPAKSKVTIMGTNMNSIEIFNLIGQRVKVIKKQSDQYVINTSSLSRSIYFVRIYTNKGYTTKKLVVQ